MDKTFYLAFSGLMMVSAGITLFFSEKLGIESSKILMPGFMLIAGISSFIFSKYDKLPKIANQYHMAQGIGLIIYSVIILSSVISLKAFLMISIYFILMYGLFELIFVFGVLSSKHKINKEVLMSRIVAGGLNLIGGFIVLITSLNNERSGLLITSALIIIGGLSLVLFTRKLKTKLL
jgi:hypothetical protein